jgi:hypothetical protein
MIIDPISFYLNNISFPTAYEVKIVVIKTWYWINPLKIDQFSINMLICIFIRINLNYSLHNTY